MSKLIVPDYSDPTKAFLELSQNEVMVEIVSQSGRFAVAKKNLKFDRELNRYLLREMVFNIRVLNEEDMEIRLLPCQVVTLHADTVSMTVEGMKYKQGKIKIAEGKL